MTELTVITAHGTCFDEECSIYEYSLEDNISNNLAYNGGKISYVRVDKNEFLYADETSRKNLLRSAIKNNKYMNKKVLTVAELIEKLQQVKNKNMPVMYLTDNSENIIITDVEYTDMGYIHCVQLV